MSARPTALASLCGMLALALAAGAAAQERQVYRYLDPDGRVVYSDRVPAAGAKDVQTKRVYGNTIETNETPIAVRYASERFPVTLYTFPCGEACDAAAALLNRRGIPFATVDVEDANNAREAEAAHRRDGSAGDAGRRQADRQGLQRGEVERDARSGRLPEDAGATHGGRRAQCRAALASQPTHLRRTRSAPGHRTRCRALCFVLATRPRHEGGASPPPERHADPP